MENAWSMCRHSVQVLVKYSQRFPTLEASRVWYNVGTKWLPLRWYIQTAFVWLEICPKTYTNDYGTLIYMCRWHSTIILWYVVCLYAPRRLVLLCTLMQHVYPNFGTHSTCQERLLTTCQTPQTLSIWCILVFGSLLGHCIVFMTCYWCPPKPNFSLPCLFVVFVVLEPSHQVRTP